MQAVGRVGYDVDILQVCRRSAEHLKVMGVKPTRRIYGRPGGARALVDARSLGSEAGVPRLARAKYFRPLLIGDAGNRIPPIIKPDCQHRLVSVADVRINPVKARLHVGRVVGREVALRPGPSRGDGI